VKECFAYQYTFYTEGKKGVGVTNSTTTDDTSSEIETISSISKEVLINSKSQVDKQKKMKKTRVVFKYRNEVLF